MFSTVQHIWKRLSRQRWGVRWPGVVGAACALGLGSPALAAKEIVVQFGPLERRLAIEDLEAFANEGRLENTVGFVLRRFSPAQQAQIRQALQTPLQGIDPVVLSQFSYTRSGEVLFQEIGEVFQTESGQNGFQSLRGAALITATQPTGFTPLEFLRQLPTDMRVDVPLLLGRVQRVRQILAETQDVVAWLEAQSQQIPSEAALNLAALPDLRGAGAVPFTQETVSFYDARRDRTLATDLYLPQTPGPIPVILISNGLGAKRDRFQELSAHLASHGFAVVIPDHPGSDHSRLRDFYDGLHRENFEAAEYLDRPQDLSFLLDQLTQRNQTEWGDRLNLEQVGVFGYSFGGTTALSLAGASLNPAYLDTRCAADNALFNISRLYQCRALELSTPEFTQDLRDERVAALYLFFPFGHSLFGEEGLGRVQGPVFWQATDLDILTPILEEQLPAYQALTTPDRYLLVSRGLPHARVTLDVLRQLTPIPDDWPTLRRISADYQNAMTVAFFQTYLRGDERYRPLLHPDYAEALTEGAYTLSLVRSLPALPQPSQPAD